MLLVLLVLHKKTIMTNNSCTNWKIATVFLCIASFTSSAWPYLIPVQKVIDATYAIETPEDAQKVLSALAPIDTKEAISAIVKLASFFSQGSGAFYSFGLFTMEFDNELKARTTLGLEKQVYLLSAAMLDERYKDYRKSLAHLETLQKQSLLLHIIALYRLPEIMAQLIPIYYEADRLNTRSDEGFNALSFAAVNALTREYRSDFPYRKQIVLALVNGGASLDGPINYQSTESIKNYLEMLGLQIQQ